MDKNTTLNGEVKVVMVGRPTSSRELWGLVGKLEDPPAFSITTEAPENILYGFTALYGFALPYQFIT
jgi:hypothetical protein